MKKLLTIAILLASFTGLKAQKIGYVDTDYILKHIPEYAAAQTELNDLSNKWQKEADDKMGEIEKLYKKYQAEQVLLSDEMRKRREEEIIQKEKEAKEFQRKKFGYEGDLYGRRVELLRPIQDKVYDAVNKVAEEGGYAILFDKTSDLVMIYTNPRYDKSDAVITKLGLKPGEIIGEK
jgi:outer membrane protein